MLLLLQCYIALYNRGSCRIRWVYTELSLTKAIGGAK